MVKLKSRRHSTVVSVVSLALLGVAITHGVWSEDLRLNIHHGNSSGLVIAEFPGESDSQYLIQETLDLTGTWWTVDSLFGEQGLQSWTNHASDLDASKSRFYRIEQIVPQLNLGDINRDGLVDSLDVGVLDQFIEHEEIPADDNQFARSDLNADGILDAKDASLLQTLIHGQSFVTISSPLPNSVITGRN